MTAVGFITFISVLSRLLGLLKKCIIIIYILCIDCAENNKILFDSKSCLTQNIVLWTSKYKPYYSTNIIILNQI